MYFQIFLKVTIALMAFHFVSFKAGFHMSYLIVFHRISLHFIAFHRISSHFIAFHRISWQFVGCP